MRRVVGSVIVVLVLVCASLAAPAAEVERIERGNLVIEGIPDIPQRIDEALLRYSNVRSASLEGWLPGDAGILISTRFGETNQVHVVREPGGSRDQLTFFDEPVGGASPSPNRETGGFLYSRDVGGSEFYQLFFYDLSSGRSRLLTDGESRNTGARWSNDGKRYAFASTQRNGRDNDIYVSTIGASAVARRVLEDTGSWSVWDWSPDDRELLVVRYVSINETHPFVLNLETGERTPVALDEGAASYRSARFSRDGKGIYLTTDAGSEFVQLRYMDRATRETRTLTGDILWDVESFTLSDDGKHIAFSVNQDGISRLHLRRIPEGKPVALPDLPLGVIRGLEFAADGRRLGLTLTTPTSPGDVWSIDLKNNAWVRWTRSEMGGLDPENLIDVRIIRYETFDTVDGKPRTIPAFYYRPKGDGPFPVLIDIHGGPEAQERPTFNPLIQYAATELGVAVLAPNVRGSAGFGKSYLLLDNGFQREDSVRDIGKLLDWIEGRPELDASRMAVIGGSYGGYMVLSSMTHFNDRLRAGIDIVGISNFVTFLENTQEYRRDLRRAEYGDERDPKMREHLTKISPTTNAHKITKPLFIAQGLNDPRVPAGESEQMVDVIRENGGQVWYLLAKDEGHGFRKKRNRDYYASAVALFLETFLAGDPQPAVSGGLSGSP